MTAGHTPSKGRLRLELGISSPSAGSRFPGITASLGHPPSFVGPETANSEVRLFFMSLASEEIEASLGRLGLEGYPRWLPGRDRDFLTRWTCMGVPETSGALEVS